MEATMTRMATIVGILLLSLMGVSLGADNTIEITIDPAGEIKQGDSVVITCFAPELTLFEYIRIVRRIDGAPHPIASAAELEPAFARTGRYFVDYPAGENKLILTIADMQGEDGGNIGCVRMNDGKVAEQFVEVKVPPKRVSLTRIEEDGAKTPVNEGQHIQFYDQTQAGLSCEVEIEGSKVVPEVQIFIGDRDVTERFTMLETLEENAEHGLLKVNNRYSYTLLQDTPDIEHNAKDITCQATMPGYEPVTSMAKVQVYYGPKFTCSETQHAKLGALEAQIKCEVKMHPAMDDVTGSKWSWGKKQNRTELITGDSLDGFTAEMVDGEGDAAEFILTIDAVTLDHFRKYRLEVGNSIGTERHTITLEEAPETTTTTTTTTTKKTPKDGSSTTGDGSGSATSLQASLIFSFVSLLLALL